MGAVPVSGSLELSGDAGTGSWEPRGIGWMAGAIGGVVRRGPCVRCGGDDAVAARGVVLDASLAHEFSKDGADGGVPGRGAFADLALRERLLGVGEHLDDALFGSVGMRRLVACGVVTQPQGGGVAVIGEFELDIVEASSGAVLARRRSAIGPQMMARIVVPAALAWLDQHGGAARPAGRFGAQEHATLGHRPRTVHPVRAVGRQPAPPWLGATPERAVEAIVLRVAGEGWRFGASCLVEQWRDGWAGYAEMGAVAWHAIGDLNRQIDSDTWTAMERALREDRLAADSTHPALEATSAGCARCSSRPAATTSPAHRTSARSARSRSPRDCGGHCAKRDPAPSRRHRRR